MGGDDDLVLLLLVCVIKMVGCSVVLLLVFLGFLALLGWLDSSVDHVVEGAAYEFVVLVVHGVELV